MSRHSDVAAVQHDGVAAVQQQLATLWNPLNVFLGVTYRDLSTKVCKWKKKIVQLWVFGLSCLPVKLLNSIPRCSSRVPALRRQVKCVLDLSLEQLIKLVSAGLSIHLKETGMQKLVSFFVFWSEVMLLLSFDNLSNCFVYSLFDIF